MQSKTVFNIFTQKEKIIKENNKKPKILADYREKNSLLPSELISLGMEIEFKELKVADFLVNNVAVERKTISDFISSMLNKRLLKQIEGLKQYPDKLLIIEGIEEQELYNDEEYGMRFSSEAIKKIAPQTRKGDSKRTARFFLHPNSIRGFLLSILLKHKIPTLFTKDYKDTARFIERIARKNKSEISIVANKKSRNKKEQMQFILEGFPGIGPKTSKKLLEAFGSIKKILDAGQEKLAKLIGKKAEIFKIIEEDY